MRGRGRGRGGFRGRGAGRPRFFRGYGYPRGGFGRGGRQMQYDMPDEGMMMPMRGRGGFRGRGDGGRGRGYYYAPMYMGEMMAPPKGMRGGYGMPMVYRGSYRRGGRGRGRGGSFNPNENRVNKPKKVRRKELGATPFGMLS